MKNANEIKFLKNRSIVKFEGEDFREKSVLTDEF